jgi:FkbM family methyltransferase
MGIHNEGTRSMILTVGEEKYTFKLRDYEDDPSDSHDLDYKVINETWIENVYRIHQSHFSGDKVFVDIGANIGSVSLYVDSFNQSLEEKIKVYAVEPEPNNIMLLNYNILNNPTENITVVTNAIWHKKDTLAISNKGGNSSIIYEKDEDFVYVKTITLKELFNKYKIKEVDVMKIDIEGAEFDLIINTPPEILAKIKYITLEFDKSFDGKFGIMVEKLSKQFGLEILGSPERGGYIYGNRY